MYEGKLIMIFDDFSLREISLNSMEESQPRNILQMNRIKPLDQPAVDFAIDKEIGAIAIATPQHVLLFDSAYNLQYQVELMSIEKIEFCSLNIVL
jgi:hypothetical protein